MAKIKDYALINKDAIGVDDRLVIETSSGTKSIHASDFVDQIDAPSTEDFNEAVNNLQSQLDTQEASIGTLEDSLSPQGISGMITEAVNALDPRFESLENDTASNADAIENVRTNFQYFKDNVVIYGTTDKPDYTLSRWEGPVTREVADQAVAAVYYVNRNNGRIWKCVATGGGPPANYYLGWLELSPKGSNRTDKELASALDSYIVYYGTEDKPSVEELVPDSIANNYVPGGLYINQTNGKMWKCINVEHYSEVNNTILWGAINSTIFELIDGLTENKVDKTTEIAGLVINNGITAKAVADATRGFMFQIGTEDKPAIEYFISSPVAETMSRGMLYINKTNGKAWRLTGLESYQGDYTATWEPVFNLEIGASYTKAESDNKFAPKNLVVATGDMSSIPPDYVGQIVKNPDSNGGFYLYIADKTVAGGFHRLRYFQDDIPQVPLVQNEREEWVVDEESEEYLALSYGDIYYTEFGESPTFRMKGFPTWSESLSDIAYLSDIPDVSGKEDESNKVEYVQNSSSTTQYPSVKAMSTYVTQGLSTKEATANRVTSINASSDNSHYPTAKAVKDYVDAAIAAAIQQLGQ